MPQQPAHPAAASTATAVIRTATTSTPTTSTTLQRSNSLSTFSFIPSAVWKEPWSPQPGPYTGFFSLASIADDVYDAASSGVVVEYLDVRASSMSCLVNKFKTMLGDAAKNGDFTHLLSIERGFHM